MDAVDFERSVGRLARLVSHDVQALVEPILAEAGLGYQQWSALVSIGADGESTCAAVARSIGHDVGATSRMLYQLEDRGLLSKRRRADDRRVVDLALTRAGREVVAAYQGRLADSWEGWLAQWSSQDLDALSALLARLRVTMAEARGAASEPA